MALPADFSKIFASTATGGITPPSDLNYAKGWEWIGSNPPEKNDFNYLQNLSDLKAKWLYDYITNNTNAASRKVGVASGNIPDMSFFTRTNNSAGMPSGLQFRYGTVSVDGAKSFSTPFPNACLGLIFGVEYTTIGNAWTITAGYRRDTLTASGFLFHAMSSRGEGTPNVEALENFSYFAWGY